MFAVIQLYSTKCLKIYFQIYNIIGIFENKSNYLKYVQKREEIGDPQSSSTSSELFLYRPRVSWLPLVQRFHYQTKIWIGYFWVSGRWQVLRCKLNLSSKGRFLKTVFTISENTLWSCLKKLLRSLLAFLISASFFKNWFLRNVSSFRPLKDFCW